MRYLFGFLCVCVFSAAPLAGCGETAPCENDVCACSEAGIRDAISKGGGPYTFSCNGPTRVVTGAEIIIYKDVILDGGRNLTLDGNGTHRVFSVPERATVELRGFGIINGWLVGRGGGISNLGNLTLRDCRVVDNESGGIFNARWLTVIDSVVSENYVPNNFGAGIFNDAATLTVMNSTVSGNFGPFGGGGIMNTNEGEATIIESVVSDNRTDRSGGGIHNSSGTLSVIDSTVSGNIAPEAGGGVYNEATLALVNSTVSENQTELVGGGIANSGVLTVTNSTVSGNRAMFGPGGGISNSGSLTLTASTLSGNEADLLGQGTAIAASDDGSIVESYATLLDGDCAASEGLDVTWVSNGYNIESPGDTCGFDQTGDQAGVPDPMLGALADNGGPTMTHALLPGSDAIDQVPVEDCLDADGKPLTTDQRGEPRPAGDGCDVGAFERQPEDP